MLELLACVRRVDVRIACVCAQRPRSGASWGWRVRLRRQGRAPFSPAVLLELPLGVVEGADLAGLQPAGDAVEVEGVVAHAPGDRALLGRRARLVRLALDACGGLGGGGASAPEAPLRGGGGGGWGGTPGAIGGATYTGP